MWAEVDRSSHSVEALVAELESPDAQVYSNGCDCHFD